eukprot:2678692-Prymnesium_polylepis.1
MARVPFAALKDGASHLRNRLARFTFHHVEPFGAGRGDARLVGIPRLKCLLARVVTIHCCHHIGRGRADQAFQSCEKLPDRTILKLLRGRLRRHAAGTFLIPSIPPPLAAEWAWLVAAGYAAAWHTPSARAHRYPVLAAPLRRASPCPKPYATLTCHSDMSPDSSC